MPCRIRIALSPSVCKVIVVAPYYRDDDVRPFVHFGHMMKGARRDEMGGWSELFLVLVMFNLL